MAMVSVVIPSYDCARYLPRFVGSTLSQTLGDLEVLVVDDGSGDDPAGAIPAGDPRVRLLRHGSNLGLPAARNTGIRAAAGRYIALLDADDWWAPTKLAEQVGLLETSPGIDLAFCDFAHVHPDGTPGPWQGGLGHRLGEYGLGLVGAGDGGFVVTGRLIHALIRHTFIHPSTALIRRSAFDRIGLFDEDQQSIEDIQMWVRLATSCRFALIDRVLASVEQRPDSVAHNYARQSRWAIRFYQSLPGLLPEIDAELAGLIRDRCAAEYKGLAWDAITRGDPAGARACYRESLRHRFRAGTATLLLKAFLPREGLLRWKRRLGL